MVAMSRHLLMVTVLVVLVAAIVLLQKIEHGKMRLPSFVGVCMVLKEMRHQRRDFGQLLGMGKRKHPLQEQHDGKRYGDDVFHFGCKCRKNRT